ncbi:metallophosphoesterase family protein [Desulfatirhabdium butyrativorans]|uniref:metallophosphoesterase family protein n=1 Tax=Desulfatirhabdium butyrativorans TaxID=340467 RepID=UPI0004023AF0|nr:metallophosphoesterase family protein [Desulfatirhabdium butyrativorans]
MRLAIVSDIHGNLEAFEAVLEDIAAQKADRTICLGDSIGYGPDPESVVRLLRLHGIESVMGNHELGIRDARILEWFNPRARASLEWTATKLSADSLSFLATLPKAIVLEKMRFVHGFPPESPLVYLFQIPDSSLSKVLERMDKQICFIGHTHVLRLAIWGPHAYDKRRLTAETVGIPPECKAIVNVGSVGQPRDGDRRAKYVLFDTQACMIEVRFIEYPRETTIRKILAAGLPKEHAERLA